MVALLNITILLYSGASGAIPISCPMPAVFQPALPASDFPASLSDCRQGNPPTGESSSQCGDRLPGLEDSYRCESVHCDRRYLPDFFDFVHIPLPVPAEPYPAAWPLI